MGKGTDKLYITHSEWSSSDAYSASAGSGVNPKQGAHSSFKRLPFNFCALSLQPFTTPVCTSSGLIFDHENIIRWLQNHNTSPVDGTPLSHKDLIKLQFAQNEAKEYVDPVTFKIFTDNTHIVAIRHGDSANVFAYDTIERLNIKAKMWRDLVSDEEFTRKDLITLQDPQNLESRNLNSFKYLKDGEDSQVPKEESGINTSAMGSSAKILKAKEAVARARAERAAGTTTTSKSTTSQLGPSTKSASTSKSTIPANTIKAPAFNASRHTTGLAAASLTSTGLTPHTSASLAVLTDEEYLLRPKRVKTKGYIRLQTTHGALDIELHPEFAPKAVWNFIRLSQSGYYNSVLFHRNIRNFMLQGGDPLGTGRGGTSIWKKPFADELDGPLKHDTRGTVSMANKGKNTNSSQFFITYRPAPHLDRKHTIFGKLLDESLPVLEKLENIAVDPTTDRPKEEIKILETTVFVDPFEEFWKKKRADDEAEKVQEEKKREREEDDRTTWTGKKVRRKGDGETGDNGNDEGDGGGGVGKYLKAALQQQHTSGHGEDEDEIVEYVDDGPPIHEPVTKKSKSSGGGFGNFDGW